MENCCKRFELEEFESSADGLLLKEVVPNGDPMEAIDDRRESIPTNDPIEQVEGLLEEFPLPGVRSMGTLRLLAEMAAPCNIF